MQPGSRSDPSQAGEVVFELAQFELADRDRLLLRGRWFGVRGRRFVRPTLTLLIDGERYRVLADLEHKPWPAADGTPWEAVFPCELGDALVEDPEVAVAPDIAVPLPPPAAEQDERRILAHSGPGVAARPHRRRERPAASGREGERPLERELAAAREEVKRLRAHVGQLRGDLDVMTTERDEARAKLEELTAEHDAAGERSRD